MRPEADKEEREEGARKPARPKRAEPIAGTTRRVYRYVYKHGPVRLYDVQRELKLSSSSVADYHIQKLLKLGLIKQDQVQDGAAGYVADRAVFEAMLRIRRTVIPLWTTATAFFASAFVALVTILRPSVVTSTYLFSLVVAAVALSISVYESLNSLGRGDRI
jgi:predicted DNA-binding transcriptional regulator